MCTFWDPKCLQIPQCAHLLNAPSVWFMNWPDDGSMSRNMLPNLQIDNKNICRVSTVYNNISIQIIQPTRCKSFTSLLLDVYVWLNMFCASPRPSSGAYNCTRSLWFYRWRKSAGAFLVVVCQTTTNNAPAASLQR